MGRVDTRSHEVLRGQLQAHLVSNFAQQPKKRGGSEEPQGLLSVWFGVSGFRGTVDAS